MNRGFGAFGDFGDKIADCGVIFLSQVGNGDDGGGNDSCGNKPREDAVLA